MQEEVVWEVGYSLTLLTGVVEEVALTVVLEQMGIEDSVFEDNVEFIVDSQILNSSSLISKGYFVGWRWPYLLWHRWIPKLRILLNLWSLWRL